VLSSRWVDTYISSVFWNFEATLLFRLSSKLQIKLDPWHWSNWKNHARMWSMVYNRQKPKGSQNKQQIEALEHAVVEFVSYSSFWTAKYNSISATKWSLSFFWSSYFWILKARCDINLTECNWSWCISHSGLKKLFFINMTKIQAFEGQRCSCSCSHWWQKNACFSHSNTGDT
jgi:hypothetical protein